jgi:TrmH family RNA methyltransferase
VKIITSEENGLFKDTRKLAESPKERKRRGASILEGTRLVRAALEKNVQLELIVVSRSGWEREDVKDLISRLEGDNAVLFSDRLFRRVSAFTGTGSMLAVIEIPGSGGSSPAGEGGDILLLEGIQDPGNLGMIIRSAAGAGMRGILLSPDCADPWSPKVLRSGMGAHFFLTLSCDTDLPAAARSFPGRVIALDAAGSTSLYTVDMSAPSALMVGSEGRGLTESLRSEADVVCTIPMPGLTESLNAAAAASIGIFEMMRQRLPVGGDR